MILRLARIEEAETCYRFIEDARAYHRSLGFTQWHPGYPTMRTILNDIENGVGYVFAQEDRPVGYCCIVIGDDPEYEVIDGAWKTERPYAVVHRMAFGENVRGKGLSHEAFGLIRAFCDQHQICSIRLDTQDENKPMRHILDREGFAYCGLITFDGGPKLAYQLDW